VLAIGGAGILAVLLLVALSHHEPTYHGRTVSGWLRQAAISGKNYTDQEINEAFRKLGSKAVPIEIKALTRKESRFDQLYRGAYPKLPAWLQKPLPEPFDPVLFQTAAWLALRFNDYTGEHLREILPLVNHENPLIRYRAASLMATHLQPEDTPVLISIVEAAQHPDPAVRSFIARALGKCTQNDAARIVLPPLRRALTDSSMQVCMNAAGSLATIDTNAMHVLTDCDLAVRVHGATVFLHKIDPKSTQAVRELVAALTDRDSDLRSSDPGRRISAKAAVAGAERWLSLSVRQNPNVAALLTKMALEDPDREIQIVARKLLDQASPDGVRSQRGSE
jgi:hypothetical protein